MSAIPTVATTESREKAAPAPQAGIAARFASRLPNLITLFFSLTLVNAFRMFADYYHWSSAPVFDPGDAAQLLVALGFLTTMFWVATAWLSWTLLVERYPYTVNLGRFYFDILRFSIMFAQMNYLFLAGKVGSFQWYPFSFAAFHLMMVLWYEGRLRHARDEERRSEWSGDARSHALRMLAYLLLGGAYLLFVSARPDAPQALAIHTLLVLLTLAAVVISGIERLRDLIGRALAESRAG